MKLRALPCLLLASAAWCAGPAALESVRLRAPAPLTADPNSPAWRGIAGVFAEGDREGKPVPGARTEIRSRWTESDLYLLYVSPYQSMYLMPGAPSKTKDTWDLWNYDVVEAFIGWDPANIQVYKEFEVSPRGEWIDLAVDRTKKPQVDAAWNSGFEAKTRIDEAAKVWYCEMRIPWKAIDPRGAAPGRELRINLYRIEGAPPGRKYIAWRPPRGMSFHAPEAFGTLRLVEGR